MEYGTETQQQIGLKWWKIPFLRTSLGKKDEGKTSFLPNEAVKQENLSPFHTTGATEKSLHTCVQQAKSIIIIIDILLNKLINCTWNKLINCTWNKSWSSMVGNTKHWSTVHVYIHARMRSHHNSCVHIHCIVGYLSCDKRIMTNSIITQKHIIHCCTPTIEIQLFTTCGVYTIRYDIAVHLCNHIVMHIHGSGSLKDKICTLHKHTHSYCTSSEHNKWPVTAVGMQHRNGIIMWICKKKNLSLPPIQILLNRDLHKEKFQSWWLLNTYTAYDKTIHIILVAEIKKNLVCLSPTTMNSMIAFKLRLKLQSKIFAYWHSSSTRQQSRRL